MKKIKDISTGPPGGQWVWRCPETGTLLRHSNFVGLRKATKAYLRDNNFPITGQFEEQFEENVCAQLPASVCFDFTPPSLLEKMTNASRSLLRWARSGAKVRGEAEVLEIANLCKACPHYGGERGFLRVVCSLCGCSSKKLYLVTEHCADKANPRW